MADEQIKNAQTPATQSFCSGLRGLIRLESFQLAPQSATLLVKRWSGRDIVKPTSVSVPGNSDALIVSKNILVVIDSRATNGYTIDNGVKGQIVYFLSGFFVVVEL